MYDSVRALLWQVWHRLAQHLIWRRMEGAILGKLALGPRKGGQGVMGQGVADDDDAGTAVSSLAITPTR